LVIPALKNFVSDNSIQPDVIEQVEIHL